MLLVAEIMPATSDSVPLIGKQRGYFFSICLFCFKGKHSYTIIQDQWWRFVYFGQAEDDTENGIVKQNFNSV